MDIKSNILNKAKSIKYNLKPINNIFRKSQTPLYRPH